MQANSSMPTTPTAQMWAFRVLSVLRIVVALVFLGHGVQKLFGFPAPPAFGMPQQFTLIWFAGVIELAGGVLLMLGLFTRPVAFLLSGEMAVAYFMAHVSRGGFFPILNGGDLAVVFCFVFLYLAFAGGGAWAIDRARTREAI